MAAVAAGPEQPRDAAEDFLDGRSVLQDCMRQNEIGLPGAFQIALVPWGRIVQRRVGAGCEGRHFLPEPAQPFCG